MSEKKKKKKKELDEKTAKELRDYMNAIWKVHHAVTEEMWRKVKTDTYDIRFCLENLTNFCFRRVIEIYEEYDLYDEDGVIQDQYYIKFLWQELLDTIKAVFCHNNSLKDKVNILSNNAYDLGRPFILKDLKKSHKKQGRKNAVANGS